MNLRRITIISALLLLIFLGVFTWNQRTGRLDFISENMGLEGAGIVLRVFIGIGDSISAAWYKYIYLMDVREENENLKDQVNTMRVQLALAEENQAELLRLRRLLNIDYAQGWPSVGARVLAQRMGPNSAMETIMISRGYLSGGASGTPISAPEGLVGRVLRAGPSTATVLLITDPGSRVAVVSSQGRIQGILAGGGLDSPLEMRFVRQNDQVQPGEILVTSGLDSAYPKGIPVAMVKAITTGSTSVREIQAVPLVDFRTLEDVLLLERPAGWLSLDPTPVYTPSPIEILIQSHDVQAALPQDNLVNDGLVNEELPGDELPGESADPGELGGENSAETGFDPDFGEGGA